MTLFIAVWAGIGFSLFAIGVADRKMEKKAHLRGVPLNPDTRFKRLVLIALASGIIFAVVTYKTLQ